MEALTRIVADSLARHGLDRPVDPRRLQWSRWSRCDSPRSLLVVPSKPGIFALAEEIMDLGPSTAQGASKAHVGTAALGCPAEQSSAAASSATTAGAGKDRYGHDVSPAVKPAINDPASAAEALWGGAALQRCDSLPEKNPPSAAEIAQRRMLAVLQFSEDDDMAFTLDRMFTRINPMRDRLASGRCFLRFVVIEDETQRRTICAALNQWMLTSAEKATGLPSDFSSSLELASMGAGSGTTRVGRTLPSASSGQALSDSASRIPKAAQVQPLIDPINSTPYLDSGASKNLHCPHPLPSGF
jgi:hypothetical protein